MDNTMSLPSPGQPAKITRADIVREASSRVPLNQLNLPEGIHRSDLLHPHPPCLKRVIPQRDLERLPSGLDLSQGKYTDEGPLLILSEDIVRSAYLPLDYSEGFPTFPHTGQPFWGQLEFEPSHCFKTFELYLKQGTEEGTRRLFALSLRPDIQQRTGNSPNTQPLNRSTASLGPTLQDPQALIDDTQQYETERLAAQRTNETLKEWHVTYYWGPRARAYDLFYLDGIRQSQGMAALQLQNDHYKDAQQLYHKVLDFIEGASPEFQTSEGLPRFWAEMTPRVLIDFMKVLSQMSRVSLGLPSNAPASLDSPTSAVGLLHSLITGHPVITQASARGSTSHRGPGRPRSAPSLDDDTDQQHPSIGSSSVSGGTPLRVAPNAREASLASPSFGLVQGPRYSTGAKFSVPPSAAPEDAERVRKIAMIFNSAKARQQASQHLSQDAKTDEEPKSDG